MTLTKRGFTLLEMLIVIAMIAVILSALTTSVQMAQQRSRIQKATAEVKAISQAILGYENFANGNELPTMSDREFDSTSFGFLLGKGASSRGGGLPVLLMAALGSTGGLTDPWGTPYRVTIRKGEVQVRLTSADGALQTGYWFPNLHALSAEERQ